MGEAEEGVKVGRQKSGQVGASREGKSGWGGRDLYALADKHAPLLMYLMSCHCH